jgi:hypothetical protein
MKKAEKRLALLGLRHAPDGAQTGTTRQWSFTLAACRRVRPAATHASLMEPQPA